MYNIVVINPSIAPHGQTLSQLHTTCQAQAQKDLRTIAFAHALSSSGITLVLKGIQSSNPSSSNNYVSETTRSKSVEESREYNINITFRNYANKYIRGTSSHYNTIARRLKKTLQDMSKSKQIKILEENANSLGNQRTQVMDDDRVLIIQIANKSRARKNRSHPQTIQGN